MCTSVEWGCSPAATTLVAVTFLSIMVHDVMKNMSSFFICKHPLFGWARMDIVIIAPVLPCKLKYFTGKTCCSLTKENISLSSQAFSVVETLILHLLRSLPIQFVDFPSQRYNKLFQKD